MPAPTRRPNALAILQGRTRRSTARRHGELFVALDLAEDVDMNHRERGERGGKKNQPVVLPSSQRSLWFITCAVTSSSRRWTGNRNPAPSTPAQRTRTVRDSIPPTTGTNRNQFRGDKSVREAHTSLSRKRERPMSRPRYRLIARNRLPAHLPVGEA